MSKLEDLNSTIAASLWNLPGDLDELHQREAFRTISPLGLELAVNILLEDSLIYQRGKKYFCYRHTTVKLNHLGFELDMKDPIHKSEFRKSFEKSVQYQ